MRYLPLLAALSLGLPALAQNYYVPDNDPAMGTSNIIPFGTGTLGSYSNCRMQVRATAAELGGIANLITGLGFSCSGSGPAHYDALEIVIDHIPATQALTTTFANNLTANAVNVLSATDYTWNVVSNTWNEVGLQRAFVFNGVDDVVVDITTTGGTAPGGMRRGTRQRIFSRSSIAPAPPTGASTPTATKFEFSLLTERTSSYGIGCAGSNGTPLHTITGMAQPGNTLGFDLSNGVPSGLALVFAGINNGVPYPFDLTFLNMPGCFAYTDLTFVATVPLDAGGAASFPFALPAGSFGFLFYSQYACLDLAANAFGFTTSNYGRVHVGS